MFLIVALSLLAQFTGNWYLADRLGSVTGITDATGALINSTTYDSYGHILSQSNPAVADQLGFTGREYDAETGLYYLRARYYNPDLGRFQSEDPSRFLAGDFNLSRYVFNRPTGYVDPHGLDANIEREEIQNAEKEATTAEERFTVTALQKGERDLFHRFPRLIGDQVLKEEPYFDPVKATYNYRLLGSINGTDGYYEISTNIFGFITHYVFIPL